MVPFDQPEASQDLFTRWIMDVPLTFNFHAAEVVKTSLPFSDKLDRIVNAA